MAKPTRRSVFCAGLAAAAAVRRLEATPAAATLGRPEGPFYKTGAPVRDNFLEPGAEGMPLRITGRVLDTEGRPIAGAVLDLWHANHEGVYDSDGFRFRGRIYSGADGSWRLTTVLPRHYRGRTAHIHCRVQGEGTALLSTELYFEGHRGNDGDRAYDPRLAVRLKDASGGKVGSFDFVLRRA
jgi:protocatechuate 3,4-dioxygenase beta subunit